ncbi:MULTISPECIES: hypothetical protein [Haloferax]|uniref:Uncharacterized protein n=2 Tax=Haloferax TaxID=2251 RepID=A0A6G1Z491_9EURY|nr:MULTISPECIES: hypothetical protein [Haloferax]KAB1188595.1 hypothetical protein Hfx1149_11330 [Haloferax sp. CBA1149]MRW81295.1 hypothetical protein [Haloferax marinisediminis]
MPDSGPTVDAPADAAAVARRYQRLERPLSGVVSLLAVGVVAAALFFFPLFVGLLIAVAIVALLRIPFFQSSGTAHLASSAATETVVDEFESETPPPLAFQWGIADSIHSETDGAVYELSYLFGLRSVTVETEVQSRESPESEPAKSEPADSEPATELTLAVTAGGQPWATYSFSIREGDAETHVDVEWESDRRFELRQLPQWFVTERYRDDVLSAQGYRVLERDASLSL